MSTSSVSSVGSGSSLTSAVAGSGALGKQAFLELLVTQLKNQDPLDPMKNEDFLAQLAQFSSVESLENLRDVSTTSSEIEAASLVGKNVYAVTGDNDTEVSGTVSAVLIGAEGATLQVGTQQVPFSDVQKVWA